MLTREQRETEYDLTSLKPAVASEDLRRRVGDDFYKSKQERGKFAKPLAWFCAGSLAAASLAMLIHANFGQTKSTLLEVKALEEAVLSAPYRGQGEFRRIRESSYLVDIDQGPVYLDEEGISVRDTRLVYMDTEIFEHLSDGNEIRVDSIREEIVKSRSVSY